MLASERFARIEETVNKRGFASTRSLAADLGVSETTIRRDCEELEEAGLLVRVHGGIKSVSNMNIVTTMNEINMDQRFAVNMEAKELVCRRAASFVEEGACVFLDGGSSILPMIKALRGKKLKIVTNSLLLLNAGIDEDSDIFCLGGQYIPKYRMNVGPITMTELDKFNFDHAFISCTGIELENGCVYTGEIDTTTIKRKAMEKSIRKYLLIDSSKVDLRGFCGFLNTDEFNTVICNADEKIDPGRLPENFILEDSED